MTEQTSKATGPLSGIRILDLTRILAGPTCTQYLGDLGADVIKIERPGAGDDTRKWGPPYAKTPEGEDTSESTYYLASNRNKRSVTVDISKPEGQALIKRLLKKCDVLTENFKVGNLAKYNLSYDDLKDEFPGLVYCSITGFGQTGPYAPRPGYDVMAQGMGGLMSLTGPVDGMPYKTGMAVADITTGMNATIAILAALHHKQKTGEGQRCDLALLDSQVAFLTYEAVNYLGSGNMPTRRGNAHSNVAPYQVVPSKDGFFIIAAGNDAQYQRFCELGGSVELGTDPRFLTNSDRIVNREELTPLVEEITMSQTSDWWLEGLEKVGVPCGPINTLDKVFENPQIEARDMHIELPHPSAGSVDLLGSPLKLSGTPVNYRHAPPTMGQHTDEVLEELLDINDAERAKLRDEGFI
ncbi:MAG: CaiB/BaiF CoA transferase family protein [Rhodospirillales bacterium]